MRAIYGLFLFFTTFSSLLSGKVPANAPLFTDQAAATSQEPRLIINNRPLAKINGKVISLYDVVKQMDLFLHDYNPDYTLSTPEKYHFYTSRWQATLDDMVANELVLLDAKQKEIQVSDGEVRERLEERFGPHIMLNLDRVNLNYEQAREIIREEMTAQQLLGMKVHAKAFQLVTPQVIKKAYHAYLEKNPLEDEWKYQVLSIKGKDPSTCEKIGEKAYSILKDHAQSLEAVAKELSEEGVCISVSDDYSNASSKISTLHFDVIKALAPNTYSLPVSQISRLDHSHVTRIFYLKDRVERLPETFEKLHDKLKNELLFEKSEKEKESYIHTLKVRFGYDKYGPKFELPEDYIPFAII